jgi:hypothetical protein
MMARLPLDIDLLPRSQKDAKRYLDKHQRRLDAAIDAYFQESNGRTTVAASSSKLNALFDRYKGECYIRIPDHHL